MLTTPKLVHKLVFLASFFGLATGNILAQNQPTAPVVKFGKVTATDFAPSPTGADSTAEAEVLYDFGDVRFAYGNNDIWMEYTCHRRIRLLKKSALERGTVTIPTYKAKASEREYVSSVDGYTFNLNGTIVSSDPLTKAGRATEKVSDQVMLDKFTLPNVREGSIIEYKYTIRTPFSVAHNPRTWTFQESIPVRWSEYRINIPDYFYYKIMMGGYLELAVREQKPSTLNLLPGQPDVPTTAHRFAVANAPAFRNEKFITTETDYLSKIDFELASINIPGVLTQNFSVGWEAMDQTLLDGNWFGGQIKRAPFLRDVASLIRSQHPKDSLARLSAAYDFVRKSMKWDGNNSYSSNGIKKVFEDKKGDAGDINMLLIALLRELDFEANPLILSTRDHGHVMPEYALMRQFNYLVAHVQTNGQEILLDATDPIIRMGMLPTRCLNGSGRLVLPDQQSRFVSLEPKERDTELMTGTFALTTDGEAKGTLTHSRGGYSGWAARTALAEEGEAKYMEAARKKRPTWQVSKSEILTASDPTNSLDVKHTLLIPEVTTEAGERIFLSPMLTEARTENPFRATERQFPVDFAAPIDESYVLTYTLPDGFTVEELPKPAVLSLPEKGGRFVYQVSQTDNKIQVISRLSLRKSVYFAEEYGNMRELFALIVAKHAEKVVLKRGEVAKK